MKRAGLYFVLLASLAYVAGLIAAGNLAESLGFTFGEVRQ